MSTVTAFDLDAFTRAIERRDAAGQLAAYADDAVIETVDHDNPPGRPAVLRGRDAISAHLGDVCSRDMEHRVTRAVLGDGGFAFEVACRYAEGTRVRCLGIAEVRDGRIVHQSGVQAWDS